MPGCTAEELDALADVRKPGALVSGGSRVVFLKPNDPPALQQLNLRIASLFLAVRVAEEGRFTLTSLRVPGRYLGLSQLTEVTKDVGPTVTADVMPYKGGVGKTILHKIGLEKRGDGVRLNVHGLLTEMAKNRGSLADLQGVFDKMDEDAQDSFLKVLELTNSSELKKLGMDDVMNNFVRWQSLDKSSVLGGGANRETPDNTITVIILSQAHTKRDDGDGDGDGDGSRTGSGPDYIDDAIFRAIVALALTKEGATSSYPLSAWVKNWMNKAYAVSPEHAAAAAQDGAPGDEPRDSTRGASSTKRKSEDDESSSSLAKRPKLRLGSTPGGGGGGGGSGGDSSQENGGEEAASVPPAEKSPSEAEKVAMNVVKGQHQAQRRADAEVTESKRGSGRPRKAKDVLKEKSDWIKRRTAHLHTVGRVVRATLGDEIVSQCPMTPSGLADIVLGINHRLLGDLTKKPQQSTVDIIAQRVSMPGHAGYYVQDVGMITHVLETLPYDVDYAIENGIALDSGSGSGSGFGDADDDDDDDDDDDNAPDHRDGPNVPGPEEVVKHREEGRKREALIDTAKRIEIPVFENAGSPEEVSSRWAQQNAKSVFEWAEILGVHAKVEVGNAKAPSLRVLHDTEPRKRGETSHAYFGTLSPYKCEICFNADTRRTPCKKHRRQLKESLSAMLQRQINVIALGSPAALGFSFRCALEYLQGIGGIVRARSSATRHDALVVCILGQDNKEDDGIRIRTAFGALVLGVHKTERPESPPLFTLCTALGTCSSLLRDGGAENKGLPLRVSSHDPLGRLGHRLPDTLTSAMGFPGVWRELDTLCCVSEYKAAITEWAKAEEAERALRDRKDGARLQDEDGNEEAKRRRIRRRVRQRMVEALGVESTGFMSHWIATSTDTASVITDEAIERRKGDIMNELVSPSKDPLKLAESFRDKILPFLRSITDVLCRKLNEAGAGRPGGAATESEVSGERGARAGGKVPAWRMRVSHFSRMASRPQARTADRDQLARVHASEVDKIASIFAQIRDTKEETIAMVHRGAEELLVPGDHLRKCSPQTKTALLLETMYALASNHPIGASPSSAHAKVLRILLVSGLVLSLVDRLMLLSLSSLMARSFANEALFRLHEEDSPTFSLFSSQLDRLAWYPDPPLAFISQGAGLGAASSAFANATIGLTKAGVNQEAPQAVSTLFSANGRFPVLPGEDPCRATLCVGTAGNGKTFIMELICALLGAIPGESFSFGSLDPTTNRVIRGKSKETTAAGMQGDNCAGLFSFWRDGWRLLSVHSKGKGDEYPSSVTDEDKAAIDAWKRRLSDLIEVYEKTLPVQKGRTVQLKKGVLVTEYSCTGYLVISNEVMKNLLGSAFADRMFPKSLRLHLKTQSEGCANDASDAARAVDPAQAASIVRMLILYHIGSYLTHVLSSAHALAFDDTATTRFLAGGQGVIRGLDAVRTRKKHRFVCDVRALDIAAKTDLLQATSELDPTSYIQALASDGGIVSNQDSASVTFSTHGITLFPSLAVTFMLARFLDLHTAMANTSSSGLSLLQRCVGVTDALHAFRTLFGRPEHASFSSEGDPAPPPAAAAEAPHAFYYELHQRTSRLYTLMASLHVYSGEVTSSDCTLKMDSGDRSGVQIPFALDKFRECMSSGLGLDPTVAAQFIEMGMATRIRIPKRKSDTWSDTTPWGIAADISAARAAGGPMKTVPLMAFTDGSETTLRVNIFGFADPAPHADRDPNSQNVTTLPFILAACKAFARPDMVRGALVRSVLAYTLPGRLDAPVAVDTRYASSPHVDALADLHGDAAAIRKGSREGGKDESAKGSVFGGEMTFQSKAGQQKGGGGAGSEGSRRIDTFLISRVLTNERADLALAPGARTRYVREADAKVFAVAASGTVSRAASKTAETASVWDPCQREGGGSRLSPDSLYANEDAAPMDAKREMSGCDGSACQPGSHAHLFGRLRGAMLEKGGAVWKNNVKKTDPFTGRANYLGLWTSLYASVYASESGDAIRVARQRVGERRVARGVPPPVTDQDKKALNKEISDEVRRSFGSAIAAKTAKRFAPLVTDVLMLVFVDSHSESGAVDMVLGMVDTLCGIQTKQLVKKKTKCRNSHEVGTVLGLTGSLTPKPKPQAPTAGSAPAGADAPVQDIVLVAPAPSEEGNKNPPGSCESEDEEAAASGTGASPIAIASSGTGSKGTTTSGSGPLRTRYRPNFESSPGNVGPTTPHAPSSVHGGGGGGGGGSSATAQDLAPVYASDTATQPARSSVHGTGTATATATATGTGTGTARGPPPATKSAKPTRLNVKSVVAEIVRPMAAKHKADYCGTNARKLFWHTVEDTNSDREDCLLVVTSAVLAMLYAMDEAAFVQASTGEEHDPHAANSLDYRWTSFSSFIHGRRIGAAVNNLVKTPSLSALELIDPASFVSVFAASYTQRVTGDYVFDLPSPSYSAMTASAYRNYAESPSMVSLFPEGCARQFRPPLVPTDPMYALRPHDYVTGVIVARYLFSKPGLQSSKCAMGRYNSFAAINCLLNDAVPKDDAIFVFVRHIKTMVDFLPPKFTADRTPDLRSLAAILAARFDIRLQTDETAS